MCASRNAFHHFGCSAVCWRLPFHVGDGLYIGSIGIAFGFLQAIKQDYRCRNRYQPDLRVVAFSCRTAIRGIDGAVFVALPTGSPAPAALGMTTSVVKLIDARRHSGNRCPYVAYRASYFRTPTGYVHQLAGLSFCVDNIAEGVTEY